MSNKTVSLGKVFFDLGGPLALAVSAVAMVGIEMHDSVKSTNQLRGAFTAAGVNDPVTQDVIKWIMYEKTDKRGNCALLNGNLAPACEKVKVAAIELGFKIK